MNVKLIIISMTIILITFVYVMNYEHTNKETKDLNNIEEIIEEEKPKETILKVPDVSLCSRMNYTIYNATHCKY